MTLSIITAIIGVISFLFFIGGLGWKLSNELSSIRIMLQVFIAKAEGREEVNNQRFLTLETRVENLEERLLEIEKK